MKNFIHNMINSDIKVNVSDLHLSEVTQLFRANNTAEISQFMTVVIASVVVLGTVVVIDKIIESSKKRA